MAERPARRWVRRQVGDECGRWAAGTVSWRGVAFGAFWPRLFFVDQRNRFHRAASGPAWERSAAFAGGSRVGVRALMAEQRRCGRRRAMLWPELSALALFVSLLRLTARPWPPTTAALAGLRAVRGVLRAAVLRRRFRWHL